MHNETDFVVVVVVVVVVFVFTARSTVFQLLFDRRYKFEHGSSMLSLVAVCPSHELPLIYEPHPNTCSLSPFIRGWLGVAKVSGILCHRGVQLIMASSWARPVILVAG